MRPPTYVWNAPGQPLSIRVALDVVARLSLEAMEGLRAVPHGGLEIGGILLGRSETREGHTCISIEGAEELESEHRAGPAYRLSEMDVRNLEEALARHADAIGLYRSRTRGGAEILDDADAQLFHRFFSGPYLFLLIAPASGKAIPFVPREGLLESPGEFPFQVGDLMAQAEQHEDVEAPQAPAPVVPVEPVMTPVASAEQANVRPPARKRLDWWMTAAAAVLAGFVLSVLLFVWLNSRGKPARMSRASVPLVATHSDKLGLSVQQDGRALRLVWNKNAPSIRDAVRGAVSITDGGHESKLELDQRDLASGVLSYWPESSDVTFRLEVFDNNRAAVDSVRALGGVPVPASQGSAAREATAEMRPSPFAAPVKPEAPPATASAATAAVPPPATIRKVESIPESEKEPVAKPAPPPPTRSQAARRTEAAAPTAAASKPFEGHAEPLPSPSSAAPRTAAAVPAPPALKETSARPQPPPLRTAPAREDAEVSVVAEPVSGSRIGKVFGKFLRRFKKPRPDTFVPPAPLHQVRPALTAEERRALTSSVPIDVKVYVAESGTVEYAEVLSNSNRHPDLAGAAVYAARKWDFLPARMGDEKVPGEVILHFRFGPRE